MQGSQERLAAREAILEMREAAVAAKEAAVLGAEGGATLSNAPGPTDGMSHDNRPGGPQEACQNG